ncbi:MAG: sigma-54-dependent transcriptional regulator [Candidatus Nitrospinota bacterium M3_3B_026]
MTVSNVLVVDDEPAIRQVLASYIRKAGYTVDVAESGEEALRKIAGGDFDIAVCDIKMPDVDGIEVIRRARAQSPETTFLMMTAYASVNTAIEAMKAGAYDYMIKPMREEDVLHRLAQVDRMIGLRNENQALRRIVLGQSEGQCRLESRAMKEVENLINKVAPTDNTVLITGESGSGKGMVARAIHQGSPRAGAPFIPVNCGAIPENLLESEFFGHVKGAFTGAVKSKKGLFLEAHNGTIFLDEIGELPLHLQVKLLHAIEDKEIRPVGGEQTRHADVRIIAATNRDPARMVERGELREDLYFRINVFHIHIPPLRERPEDIMALVKFFLDRETAKLTPGKSCGLDPDAEEALLGHDWPGNVRELENIVTRAFTMADGDRITISDLPPNVMRTTLRQEPESGAGGQGKNLREQVRLFEANLIQQTLDETDGDRKLAAQRLGIGLSSLYRKIEEIEKSGSLN